ncbi:MAG: hypothetical protein WC924_00485 [Candidatus Gracilibacteria bacterium]
MKKAAYSLSQYFPEGTEYFYGYPAEEDSHFYNGVSPEIEELVALRPIICAGPNVKTICFSDTLKPETFNILRDDLGVIKVPDKQIISLPEEIDVSKRGKDRNRLIKQALVGLATPGRLIMAQPYLDTRLKTYYRIPSHRIIWINDKRNMSSYIPKAYLPEVYDEFLDGQCFIDSQEQLPLPCVVKVSSSSSGDGVRICRKEADIEKAKQDFKHLEGIIFVTELIEIERNFGVQFGISHDPDQAIDIINWHEQLIDKRGAFVGGVIEQNTDQSYFKMLDKVLLEEILPEIRRKGWYGIGGFDVLMTKDERFYFIDPNFRMTGMTVYDLLYKNKTIESSMLSFMGTFEGTAKAFQKRVVPLASGKDKKMYITTLAKHGDTFSFNTALLYEGCKDIPKIAEKLMKAGIQSDVLKGLVS